MSNLEEQKAQWMLSALGIDVGRARGTTPSSPGGESGLAREIEAASTRLAGQLEKGANRPTKILDRLSYVKSEIRNLKERVDKQSPEGEKAALLKRLKDMEGTLAETVKASMNRSVKALLEDLKQAQESIRTARESVDLITDKVDPAQRKQAYKLASSGAAKVFLSETDWRTEIKQGRSLPGIDALNKPFEELRRQRELLDELVARMLPQLSSKPKAPVSGGEDAVEKAPDSHVIELGKEVETIRACGGDWADAKAKYGRYKGEMSKLAKFRKQVVDEWLVKTLTPWGMAEGTGKGWVAVGSDDPTSDYDISINKHGLQGEGRAQKIYYDYQIVKDFNAHFRQKYGCETGTIFDTNLYASAPPLVAGPPKDGTKEEVEAYEDIVASNDVGALMKQRRYMSAAEFNAYRDQVLQDLPEGARKQMAKRFEKADDNYMISLLSTVEAMRKMLKQAQQSGTELTENQQKALDIIKEFDEGQDKGGSDLVDAPETLEHVAHQLMHDCKDASTMATNEIYAESKAGVREAEIKVDTLQKIREQATEFLQTLRSDFDQDIVTELLMQMADALETLSKQAADDLRKGIAKGDKASLVNGVINAQDRIKAIAPGLLSDLANAQTLNMFYANEAYQSGGPFKHVVYAGQAVVTDVKNDPAMKGKTDEEIAQRVKEVTKQRRDELTASERLDSFNEQLGDFLKDLAHYGDEDPGVAIIQSSKYLDRLLDAAALLDEKSLFDKDSSLKDDIKNQVSRQNDIRNLLIAARKGKLVMEGEGEEPVNQVEQRRAFACDFMRKMGINSVAGLGRTYSDLGIRVNVAVRKAMAHA